MEKASLGSLPDELLLEIVEHLDTARDVAHLGALTKRSRSLVERDGWCTFVKTHFSSLNIPVHSQTKWDAIANRATYLDRCWDKRGIVFTALYENKKPLRGYRSAMPRGQSVSFRTVIDARLFPSREEEVFAVGAGEDLLIRLRPQSGKGEDVWHTLEGKTCGYRPGTGDVTAISVIEHDGLPCVVAGRANGDIQILSAEDDFVQSLQNLTLNDQDEQNRASDPMRKSPGQLAVSWTEWEPQSNLLASSKGSLLALHELSASGDTLNPISHYDFYEGDAGGEPSLVRGIKFMSKDVVACALGGSKEPLRWGRLLPTGLEFFNAIKKPHLILDQVAAQIEESTRTTVRAIEPVRGGGSESLLLSAWDDGTHRLMDLRTPSTHDAIYRDKFQPNDAGGSLLVYGTERFITSVHHSRVPVLHFYDFRWPKSYYHSTAIPCADEDPFPLPGTPTSDNPLPEYRSKGSSSQCDHQSGSLCRFHERARSKYWRPDASISIGNTSYDHIYNLAKASDLSDSFYCGYRGGVMESSWRLYDDDQNSVTPSAPAGWCAGRTRDKTIMFETGISLCGPLEWNLLGRGNSQMPIAMKRAPQDPPVRNPRQRIDEAFWN